MVARDVDPAHRRRHRSSMELSPRLSLRRGKTACSEPTPANSLDREVENSEGFTRKIEDVREADFRLANHRLQPLGHLTVARKLSIRQTSSYVSAPPLQIVPEIVPASSRTRRESATLHASGALIRTQRFFLTTTMPATDWSAPPYSHELTSTYLISCVSRNAKRA
jgi:hypothetical protein